MVQIPLTAGYTPKQWRKCLDVMILKKAGLLKVDSLRTIVLFQPDCNYAFKFLSRAMMKHAEKHQTLAPEQFGSRKNHRVIDLATNKVLTNDIIHQTKSPGAMCANDTKTCYDLRVHPSAALPHKTARGVGGTHFHYLENHHLSFTSFQPFFGGL
jgi:hypothetical protein